MRRIKPDQKVIEWLQRELHQQLKKYLSPGSEYLLLDWPGHANVGDNAIWLGELQALRHITENGPLLVAPNANPAFGRFEPPKNSSILLHGGGNFGDLWGNHQENRIKLLDRFTSHPIIQLPQSIFFKSEALVERTAQAIRKHGHFILMTRDQQSHDFAKNHFDCEVTLTPDAAFGLGPIATTTTATARYSLLMRRDSEKAANTPSAKELLDIDFAYDWTKFPKPPAKERLATWLAFKKRWFEEALRQRAALACERQSRYRLAYGLRMLQRGEEVITDRLHGHILSFLLGKTHYAFDNSYGKTFGYMDTWYPELSEPADWRTLANR